MMPCMLHTIDHQFRPQPGSASGLIDPVRRDICGINIDLDVNIVRVINNPISGMSRNARRANRKHE